jgi:hypothetical protein
MTREKWIAEFGPFLRTRGIKHFTPTELCDVGAVHKGATLCAPLKQLWGNIVVTAICAELIRAELRKLYPRAILSITSGYRDPAYNLTWGSDDGSLHVKFNALDIEGYEAPGGPEIPAGQVRQLALALPIAGAMGIGKYPGFTHIDTRGMLGMPAARW